MTSDASELAARACASKVCAFRRSSDSVASRIAARLARFASILRWIRSTGVGARRGSFSSGTKNGLSGYSCMVCCGHARDADSLCRGRPARPRVK